MKEFHLRDSQALADPVLRCSCYMNQAVSDLHLIKLNPLRYLYEREYYIDALQMIQTALRSFEKDNSLAYAIAVEISVLLQLDDADAEKALQIFQFVWRIREALPGPDDAFIASSLNNMALNHTELNSFSQALPCCQKAMGIGLRTNCERPHWQFLKHYVNHFPSHAETRRS